MRKLLSPAGKKAFLRSFGARRRLFLFLDFDGTLSRVVSRPSLARLDRRVGRELKRLAKNPRLKMFVVSGRGLSDIRQKVGIAGIVYAANHGLEWMEGRKIRHVPIPADQSRALRALKGEFAKLARTYAGAYVEDKGFTLALHYRQVAKSKQTGFKRRARELARVFLKTHQLSVLSGKKTFDVRPNLKWTKAEFVALMIKKYARHRKTRAIYIGDDITDEDVFTRLPRVIGIRVGTSRRSAAGYFARSVREVGDFFEFLSDFFGRTS